MAINLTQAEVQERVEAMLKGWSQPLDPALVAVAIKGTSVTPDELRQRLELFLDLLKAPDRTRAAYLAAVRRRREGEAAGWALIQDLSEVVVHQFGEEEAHQRFGVAISKAPAKPSTETLVIANDKRQRTRRERGIMGRRQRAALQGGPTVTVTLNESQPGALPAAKPAPALPAAPAPQADE